MNNLNPPLDLNEFDVREIPCRIKHGQIFQRWNELPVGSHFVLINDHDPVPLYYQFAAMFPGAFTWEYLASEGDEVRVKIARVAASPTNIAVPPPPSPCGGAVENTAFLDLRGLQPPEPMLRILQAVEKLAPGATLRAHTDRKPIYLYPELDTRGIRHLTEEQANGSCIIRLERA